MENSVIGFFASIENFSIVMVALAIGAARPLGFVIMCPIFSRFAIKEGIVRGGVLVALTLPVFPSVLTEIHAAGVPEPTSMLMIIVKEMAIGFLLALITGLPFWAAATAGDFIDMGRGASMGNLVDPGSGGETSVTGTFLFLTCVLWLIAAGVFIPAVFGPLFETYKVYPVLEMLPALNPENGALALDFLSDLARAGLVLAIPILIPMFLVEALLAISGKYIQQLNVMFLSMSVKQAIYVLILLIYAAAFAGYVSGLVGERTAANDMLKAFLGVAP